jgi:hypothetical protein
MISLTPKKPKVEEDKDKKPDANKPAAGPSPILANKPKKVIGPNDIPKMKPMAPGDQKVRAGALAMYAGFVNSGLKRSDSELKDLFKKIIMERAMKKAKKELNVFDTNQLKVAQKTLTMVKEGPLILGGPSHAEAREIIQRITGKAAPILPEHGDYEDLTKKSLFSEEDLIGKTEEIKKSNIDQDASRLYKKSPDEPVAKSDAYAGTKVDEMFKGWFIRQPEEMETTKRGKKIVDTSASGKPRLLSSFVNRAPAVSAQAYKASELANGPWGNKDQHHDAMKVHLSAAFHAHLAGNSDIAHEHMDIAKEHQDAIGDEKIHGKAKWQERFGDTASYVGWPKKD